MRNLCLAMGVLVSGAAFAQDFDKLKVAVGDAHLGDGWIYEDIEKGYAEARRTGKPLLAVFR